MSGLVQDQIKILSIHNLLPKFAAVCQKTATFSCNVSPPRRWL